MAAGGNNPKHNRQRRDTPIRGDWVRLAPLPEPVIPELDEYKTVDGEPWTDLARLQWDAWRVDPATALWNPADLAYAVATIQLVHSSAVSKENGIRLRMESLGLTPKGRADRRLLLPDERAPDDGSAVTPASGSSETGRQLPEAV